MARVRLGRREAEEGDLPAVCMRCGAPAETFKRKRFWWHPPWVIVLLFVSVLVYVIVAFILTKRMRVQAPMCPAHTGHWFWRIVFVLGGLVALVCLGLGATVAADELQWQPGFRDVGDYLYIGVAVLGGVWLIIAAVLHQTAIRATEITNRSITLVKVAPDFTEALRDYREDRYEEDDWEPRRRRPPRFEEDDEDDYYDRDR